MTALLLMVPMVVVAVICAATATHLIRGAATLPNRLMALGMIVSMLLQVCAMIAMQQAPSIRQAEASGQAQHAREMVEALGGPANYVEYLKATRRE